MQRIHGLIQTLRIASFPYKFRGYSRFYTSRAATSVQEICDQSPLSCDEDENGGAERDWDNLGFGLVTTDYMYVMKCRNDGIFAHGELNRYGNIELSPCAGVLNYAQGLFEGTKAYRKEVPPYGKGTLYIRPLLLGTGPVLGLAPAPEYTFLVYASPVGNYFKQVSEALKLYVEEDYARAAHLGTGGVKTISNYGPVLKALTKAKSRGFSDVLYLDSVEKKYLEEVSSCNIFILKGKVISTPATRGTILPGVTRKSIIEIARDQGYKVEERLVSVDELLDADEVFCTGTAVVVAPVGSITFQNQRMFCQLVFAGSNTRRELKQ
ncbi:Branched-chain-amino-acid aminotransferase 2, chloroplastic [Linum perenne]